MNTTGGFRTTGGNAVDAVQNAGAPVDGVDAQHTLTSTGSAGTFALTFTNPLSGVSQKTGPLAFNISAVNLTAALQALSNMPANALGAATGGPLNTTPIVQPFTGDLSGLVVPILVADNTLLTGAVTPSINVAGVQGTARGTPKGQLLLDTTTPKVHQNSGTANKPVWGKVGVQS